MLTLREELLLLLLLSLTLLPAEEPAAEFLTLLLLLVVVRREVPEVCDPPLLFPPLLPLLMTTRSLREVPVVTEVLRLLLEGVWRRGVLIPLLPLLLPPLLPPRFMAVPWKVLSVERLLTELPVRPVVVRLVLLLYPVLLL